MIKTLCILGPTATGKSDLAVQLAQKYNGEIISADSRQVYKGLTIGSGKITKKEMMGVPHHLLDVADPRKRFSVADFTQLGKEAIETIHAKGKLPIICGGTGFYIQALLDGIILPEIPPNDSLRKKLSDKSASQLHTILKKLDPIRAKNIDGKNTHRLIRAIEIATALGKVPSLKKVKSDYQTLFIGLNLPPEILKEKIKVRLEKRFKKGMLEEVAELHKNGLTWKRMHELGLEYRYISLYLQKKITFDEMKEKLFNEIWHYAKRQMTWFKRDTRITWYSPEDLKSIDTKVQKFI